MLDRVAIGNLFYRYTATSPQIVKKHNTTQYSDKSVHSPKIPQILPFFVITPIVKIWDTTHL